MKCKISQRCARMLRRSHGRALLLASGLEFTQFQRALAVHPDKLTGFGRGAERFTPALYSLRCYTPRKPLTGCGKKGRPTGLNRDPWAEVTDISYAFSSSSNTLASFRSAVSKPSVNQP
jgi:hypothetical protein